MPPDARVTVPSQANDLLLVEDDPSHAELILRAFEDDPLFQVRLANDLAAAHRAVAERTPDLVVADLRLPDGDGLGLLPTDRNESPYPVIVMTSHGDETRAVEAMKAGALDYLVKTESSFADMPHLAQRALREWRLVKERQRAERELELRDRELRQAQKMEAVGRLASSLAHDFNNVLMGIIGCADVALSELASGSDPRRYVQELKRAALASSARVRELLAFSKGATDTTTLELDAAILSTQRLIRLMTSNPVVVDFDLGAPGAHVRCGVGEVEQLVMNLCINARDAMPAGGQLVLRSRSVLLSQEAVAQLPPLAPGPHVLLTVLDTGSGMHESIRVRAFEPFFTTKGPDKGTGLGLSSVYGTVHRSAGRIELSSEHGKGTEFRIYLPEVPAAGVEPSAVPPPPVASASVLVVDDESLVRLSVRHYLEQSGHRVVEASTADQAELLCEDTNFEIDLVVTDIALPGIQGPELARRLEALRPGLPIVFMSGHAHRVPHDPSLPPETEILRKPFNRDELQAALARTLAHTRLRPPSTDAATPKMLDSSNHPARTLLYVDDEPRARAAAVELLSDMGFCMLDAGTAAGARKTWAAHAAEIDAVIMDLMLPDGNGLNLAREFRKLRPDIVIVFVSGRSCDDPELRSALDRPHTAFVQKPVEIEQLAAVTRNLLK